MKPLSLEKPVCLISIGNKFHPGVTARPTRAQRSGELFPYSRRCISLGDEELAVPEAPLSGSVGNISPADNGDSFWRTFSLKVWWMWVWKFYVTVDLWSDFLPKYPKWLAYKAMIYLHQFSIWHENFKKVHRRRVIGLSIQNALHSMLRWSISWTMIRLMWRVSNLTHISRRGNPAIHQCALRFGQIEYVDCVQQDEESSWSIGEENKPQICEWLASWRSKRNQLELCLWRNNKSCT